MSSLCKRLAKPKKLIVRKVRQEMNRRCRKEYTSFNVFTRNGKNMVLHTQRPMTEVEVQYIYGVLSVSGID